MSTGHRCPVAIAPRVVSPVYYACMLCMCYSWLRHQAAACDRAVQDVATNQQGPCDDGNACTINDACNFGMHSICVTSEADLVRSCVMTASSPPTGVAAGQSAILTQASARCAPAYTARLCARVRIELTHLSKQSAHWTCLPCAVEGTAPRLPTPHANTLTGAGGARGCSVAIHT